MRFLRLLTNSLLAGALGAAYLTILVLHLNPEVPLVSPSVWPGPRCSSVAAGRVSHPRRRRETP